MSTAHATAITIYPARDSKDVYVMHRDLMGPDQELVATIIEWSDIVEVRVHRKLDAEEHAAAMAFVGRLNGQLGCLVNYDPADWTADVTIPKATTDASKATMPAAAPKPPARSTDPLPTDQGRKLPRMVVLPSSRAEKMQDGWLRARRAMTHDPNAPQCPSCRGVGYINAYVKTGRNRLTECMRCNGSGSLPVPPKEAA